MMDWNHIMAACLRPPATMLCFGTFYMIMDRRGYLTSIVRKSMGNIVTNMLLPMTIFISFAEQMSFEEFKTSYTILIFISVSILIGYLYSLLINRIFDLGDNFKHIFTMMCMFPDHVVNPLIVTDAVCRTQDRWTLEKCNQRFTSIIWLQAPIFYTGMIIATSGTMDPKFRYQDMLTNPILLASFFGLITGMISPLSEFVTENIWMGDIYGPFRLCGSTAVPLILFLSYGKLMKNVCRLFTEEKKVDSFDFEQKDHKDDAGGKQHTDPEEDYELRQLESLSMDLGALGESAIELRQLPSLSADLGISVEEIGMRPVIIAFLSLFFLGIMKFVTIWFSFDGDVQVKILMLSACLMPTAVTLTVLVMKHDEVAAGAILFTISIHLVVNVAMVSGAIILIVEYII